MFLSVVSCSTVFGEETCCVIDNSCYQMLPIVLIICSQLLYLLRLKQLQHTFPLKMLFLRLDDETLFTISCNFIA